MNKFLLIALSIVMQPLSAMDTLNYLVCCGKVDRVGCAIWWNNFPKVRQMVEQGKIPITKVKEYEDYADELATVYTIARDARKFVSVNSGLGSLYATLLGLSGFGIVVLALNPTWQNVTSLGIPAGYAFFNSTKNLFKIMAGHDTDEKIAQLTAIKHILQKHRTGTINTTMGDEA